MFIISGICSGITRFGFLLYFLSVYLCLVLFSTNKACASERSEKPNVIIIFTDDQGSIDLNCYGAKDLITPHMDSIANRGIRFTQFYAAAPVCSPSRAGLLTGKFPQRAGVPGNVSSQHGKSGMPAEQVTIAEMLKDAGYRTGHVGKWHLGYTKETMPNGQGFDESFGHMGGCIDNYSHFFYWNGPNRHDLWKNGKEVWHDGTYFPDLMVRQCQNYIKEHRDEPFFLYWAINVPHYPLQATDKWRKKYAHLPSPRNKYAAFVSTMDDCIGEVLKTLDEFKLRENTIVIFQSDHGHSQEERTFGGGGSAGPFRGAKFSLFEGGIRVPAMISWPGTIAKGEKRHQMATGCDWLPTIAELTGTPLPQQKLNGKSLKTVIDSSEAQSPHRDFYWQIGKSWAIREGDWKLLGNPRDTSQQGQLTKQDQLFLVDLSNDPGEKRNLAASNPAKLERLKQIYRRYQTSLSK
ncbi:sulfatase-like hydrolase/transferase [Gimesia aquarii]|uniref:Arylsulfatase n=1 Tax=Gimesia aquarii TaxID=2527964 RepID=A0A517VNW3_9PLAN|nr:sulfatase-like hydrolase/transferase [Gimesia aquarii]QDT94697.1 Arylsulfatase [Gimesia aquarii]